MTDANRIPSAVETDVQAADGAVAEGWRARAKAVKKDIRALRLALTDARTPWYVKALAFCVVVYAISPIDLIPDPIPIVGYLDDMILLPMGIWLIVKLVPPQVLADCRRRADEPPGRSRLRWVGATVVLAIWLAVLLLMMKWCLTWWAGVQTGAPASAVDNLGFLDIGAVHADACEYADTQSRRSANA